MTRILTGIVGGFLTVLAVFRLPHLGFGIFCSLIFLGAVWEFQRIVRHWVPRGPLGLLLVSVPTFAAGLSLWLSGAASIGGDGIPEMVFVGAAGLSVGVGLVVLLFRTPVEESLPAMGVLCFGTLYFAVPLASLTEIHRLDPWLLMLTLAIVWLGDAAAFYVGRMLGKKKLAPVVSPNKTWAGAVASFLMALAVTAGWSLWHHGSLDPRLLGVAALVSVSGQMGDLVNSMIKRGASVKDSGWLLPGHGGFYDRIDALLFGAPAMLIGLYWLAF